ncbi:unnamed protein product [marine sediment metagenome]|uniref:Uncharacterized protein n=1 Tax=marine sediment metagenome TaxID=412755 RepID=X0VYA2_9ZZZZ
MSKIIRAEEIHTRDELEEMPQCPHCQHYFDNPNDIDEETELCEDCEPLFHEGHKIGGCFECKMD